MTAFINTTSINSSVYLTIQERQLGSKQDIAISGRNLLTKNGQACDWILVADGHGGKQTINILKYLDIEQDILNEIIAADKPMTALVAHMKQHNITDSSGATCIIVKIFTDRIQCWNVGDSQVAIYINGQSVYINCPHNMRNPLEQTRLAERIKNKTVIIEKMKDQVPVIATKTTMTNRKGEYIYFGNLKIAMSQALGDGWVTGIEPEQFEYTFDSNDIVRVVAGTDGFWEQYIFDGPDAAEDLLNITTLSAEQLIDIAAKRWKQEWTYYWNPRDPDDFIVTEYGGAYDDIALAIWSNRMPGPILLQTDQLEALDMWQDVEAGLQDVGAKQKPLWELDGEDPEFDAKALDLWKNTIIKYYANKKKVGEAEGGEGEVAEVAEVAAVAVAAEVGIYDDMPGLIIDEEFHYFKKVIEYYGTLVELEQEYIRSGLGIGPESFEIKDVLIRCITISVAKMTKNEMKLKLSNKSDYELQEMTNIEIELIKERLAKE